MYPVAYAALLLLIPVTVVAFAMLRPHQAVAVVMVGAVLFLPERVGIDFPVLPAFDKLSLPPLVVFAAALATAPQRFSFSRFSTRSDLLLVAFVAITLVSGLANGDALRYGPRFLPGVSVTDTLSDVLRGTLTCVLPYLIGKAFARDRRELTDLMSIVLVGGVLYLPLIAFELRMSPQLHRMVYGFAQHFFAQTIRAGGYRPMVFMAHGLALASFMFMSTVFAWTLMRARVGLFRRWALPLTGVMSITLVVIKSLGALLYGLASVPLVFFAKRRLTLIIAAAVSVLVLAYPTMRAAGTFPTTDLVQAAAWYNEERAGSLDFRFINEDILLAKAGQRPYFGWGPMGRSRIYDERGNDVAVTDGTWVIVRGVYGSLGFFAYFGVLVNAVLTGARAVGSLPRKEATLLSALLWVNAFNLIDLIPNSMFSYLTFWLAGSLVGASNGLVREARRGRLAAAQGRAALSGAVAAPSQTSRRRH